MKAICCKNWDTNNDGELSYAEAAAVTTIGTKFKGNTNIIAFTELKYFTGITKIPENAFNGCTSLWKVAWSESVKTVGNRAFYNNKGLSNINFLAEVTTIGDSAFYGCSGVLSATIPDSVTKIGSSVL